MLHLALVCVAFALDPALEPYESLVGRWVRGGASETWVAAGDALVGVGFAEGPRGTTFFEVLQLVAIDGRVDYVARPAGGPAVAFRAEGWTFSAPTHDFPKWIRYEPRSDRLFAEIGDDAQTLSFRWKRAPEEPDAGLVRADRAIGKAPLAAGLSPDGALGFTAGVGYVTVWRRDPSGRWDVVFDTAR